MTLGCRDDDPNDCPFKVGDVIEATDEFFRGRRYECFDVAWHQYREPRADGKPGYWIVNFERGGSAPCSHFRLISRPGMPYTVADLLSAIRQAKEALDGSYEIIDSRVDCECLVGVLCQPCKWQSAVNGARRWLAAIVDGEDRKAGGA